MFVESEKKRHLIISHWSTSSSVFRVRLSDLVGLGLVFGPAPREKRLGFLVAFPVDGCPAYEMVPHVGFTLQRELCFTSFAGLLYDKAEKEHWCLMIDDHFCVDIKVDLLLPVGSCTRDVGYACACG